ncbi:unnamed protein product [Angiostrongylus costaricensis]|uniref:Dynein light chain n=1 Tax=Angiostrongylus costaricensis TaxID=334426 RepID=A0A0R3PUK8_ANGCS|nr:unnamed protein product [Angiostrongylus costaricensis]
MASSDDCYPKTVKECRIAADALKLEIAERTKFDSKILVHGQEDVLTLHEYEVCVPSSVLTSMCRMSLSM